MAATIAESLAGPLPAPADADELIDREQLGDGDNLLASLRDALTRLDADLGERFRGGEDVAALVRSRAWGVEQLLLYGWDARVPEALGLTLVAVGGFGRGALHPHSDVDLLVLFEKGDLSDAQKEAIECFVALLWDAGFYLGHSVRNLAQCREEALADVGTATSLMEARYLSGSRALFDALHRAVAPEVMWSARDFFNAKMEEQAARHAQYGDTAYNLEPNVKDGPGGLRDIQMIEWVTRRHFDATGLHGLVEHGFLTDSEFRELVEGQYYLWWVRYALHLITKRAEDRLLFDVQRQVAEFFGFRDDGGSNLAVERFMQGYYRVVTGLERLNERLLQLFSEELLSESAPPSEDLGEDFVLLHGFLDLRDPGLFKRRPQALMELFDVLARSEKALGVRASAVRQIVDHLYLIDDDFRNDPQVLASFYNMLSRPSGVYTQLQRMNRYGVLAAFIPAFAQIVGRMQFDLFHVYTVDQHILFTVRNLRRLAYPKYNGIYPNAPKVFATMEEPAILYVAALFHDIAKGRGGDHSELGKVDALAFARKMPMSEADAQLVAWMVENHLLMSQTAQKKDIGDPETIAEFTAIVDSRRKLEHLYLLTVADVSATSPRLWNGWKSGLLWELFQAAWSSLDEDDDTPTDRAGQIEHSRDEVLEQLVGEGLDAARVRAFWAGLPASVFLRFSDAQLAWATAAALQHGEDGTQVAVRLRAEREVTELLVCAEDYTGLFATITAVMDELGLDVLTARVVTSASGRSFDLFQVMDRHGNPLNDIDSSVLARRLRAELDARNKLAPVMRPLPRRLRPFVAAPTLHFRTARDGAVTEMEIECSDRPGLLSQLSAALAASEVRIHDAMIATFGDRVEDTFLVTDRADKPLDETLQKRLADEIHRRLDS
ncbi:[protein-PII] uridylyltransferase [Marinihelvus fidelis]|uniref:Bifunctional uridylyltransferase/uridylyl-removing enzyme n=1 Tax=Marinihelvus fidelis TaxID=2613842 RepID=A0A5N0TJQ4_9GAMM|nr:[protein-PII] uridylyltransferase [Marinihelvus fidelis]KAA9133559.1 [protein-PII] uridylyltransferase [Marinihelvus fidelis]